jgi:hypothetical protein
MPKFTRSERVEIKNIVASLSIKRIIDQQILSEVFRQIGKPITQKHVYNARQ